jgi:NAD(P)-dependent dehydrogenase (short-subunit alcohol dehydrogenase family)
LHVVGATIENPPVSEPSEDSGLTGHVALVTGGVRGIGLGISERLVAAGVRVAAGYSRASEASASFLERHGGSGATIHQGNIGRNEDCARVVGEVIEEHGRLDILVNNAGVTMDRTVRRMSPEEWDHVLQVNLHGTFYMCRAVLPHMIDRGYGRIVNISSVIGEIGNIGQANYAASKAGLFGLTMSLARECANKGITVNSVAPGFIRTEMVEAVPEEALAKVVARIPVGRLGEADEVARVVEFLADPRSSYITGDVYSINGGLAM